MVDKTTEVRPPRRRGRPSTVPERRRALVEAAFEAVAAEGFEGLRMRGIAARVGGDHSTIRHYFASKEALVEAVAEYATGQFRGTTPMAGSGTDRLAGHLRTLAARIAAEPNLHAVMRELDLRANRDAALRGTLNNLERGWRHNLQGLIRQAIDEGAVDPEVSPADTAELIVAVAKGASLDPQTAPAAIRQLARLLILEPADLNNGDERETRKA
jgi:AcrR family transcriptional regulator